MIKDTPPSLLSLDQLTSLLESDEILGVTLPVIEGHEDLRVGNLVDRSVVRFSGIVGIILTGRNEQPLFSDCELSNQDSSQVHVPPATLIRWRVGGAS